MTDPLLWAFDYMFHMDKANACMHCAPVRFSPITFRLAEALLDAWPVDEVITAALAEVHSHMGQYAEDPGR